MGGVIPIHAPDGSCSICTESLKDDVVHIVACGHSFHLMCVLAWFQSNAVRRGSCPDCRKELYEPDPIAVRVVPNVMNSRPPPLPGNVPSSGRWAPVPNLVDVLPNLGSTTPPSRIPPPRFTGPASMAYNNYMDGLFRATTRLPTRPVQSGPSNFTPTSGSAAADISANRARPYSRHVPARLQEQNAASTRSDLRAGRARAVRNRSMSPVRDRSTSPTYTPRYSPVSPRYNPVSPRYVPTSPTFPRPREA